MVGGGYRGPSLLRQPGQVVQIALLGIFRADGEDPKALGAAAAVVDAALSRETQFEDRDYVEILFVGGYSLILLYLL